MGGQPPLCRKRKREKTGAHPELELPHLSVAEEFVGKKVHHAVSAGYRICLKTQNTSNMEGSVDKGSYFFVHK